MYAVFFETQPVDTGRPQYLVFPTEYSDAVIFSRVSNGGRNGKNRWEPIETIPTDQVLVREPTAMVVTENDQSQYLTTGLPQVMTVKAQASSDRAPESDRSTATLVDLYDRVALRDLTLRDWVRDGRRARPIPIVTVPAPNNPDPVVVSVPVTPTVTTDDTVRETVTAPAVRMALVPEPALASRYIHREISGVQDFAIFDSALEQKKNVLLYGPTGPGKTTSAIAYAAEKGLPMFMVSGAVSLESSQLFGRFIPDGVGGFVWQDGGVTECVRHGGVLILDEVNFIPSKIATVLFSLLADTRHITLLDHRGETIRAHEDLLVVATMNPDYHGTQELNAALRNRFRYQISWGYDDAVERKLVPAKSLRALASALRAQEATESIQTPTPTNALVDFLDIAKDLGLDFAVSNFTSRYLSDEQTAVRLVLDTHRANIEADLGITQEVPSVDTSEVFTSEGSTDAYDEDTLRRLTGIGISG